MFFFFFLGQTNEGCSSRHPQQETLPLHMLYFRIKSVKQLCCMSIHLKYVSKKQMSFITRLQRWPSGAVPPSGLLSPPLFETSSNSVNPVNYRGEETSPDHEIRGEKIRPTETWPVTARRQMAFSSNTLASESLLQFERQNRSIFYFRVSQWNLHTVYVNSMHLFLKWGALQE